MRVAFAVLLFVHGTIHFAGFAKSFGLLALSQLKGPIGQTLGVVWLLAGLGFVTSAAAVIGWPRIWWAIAGGALIASQVAIASSWVDAKYGTIINLIILVPLLISALDERKTSLPSLYRRDVVALLSTASGASDVIQERDLSKVPPLVEKYLRRVGVVGRPAVRNFKARFTGTLRNGTHGRWMPIRAEQYEFFGDPARIFLMNAALFGVPFTALHRYEGSSARMQVRVASLFDVVDARGREMNQSETVTLFNDLCLLAPAALLNANVRWVAKDERTVTGVFTNAGSTISADLSFNEAGDLVDFTSTDRYLSADGRVYRSLPWSTPMRDYREFHGVRLAARATAIWHEPTGTFEYARFVLEDIEYNVTPSASALSWSLRRQPSSRER